LLDSNVTPSVPANRVEINPMFLDIRELPYRITPIGLGDRWIFRARSDRMKLFGYFIAHYRNILVCVNRKNQYMAV